MIKRDTVFILGAGASADFDYPLGDQLRVEICQLNNSKKNTVQSLANALADSTLPPQILSREVLRYQKEIVEFAKNLYHDVDSSIDAFLERFKKKYLTIGKMAIAQTLVKYEEHDRLFSKRYENWYHILYEKMKQSSTIDTLKNNKVSFISFNYDRSLEHFLYTALQSYHEDITEQKVLEIINSFPIIHLYGQLDPLPWQNPSGRPYGSPYTPAQFKEYQNSLNIVFEEITKEVDSRFNSAFDLLKDADRVYILGFGFDDDNISRLRLRKITPKEVSGTAYKFENKQKMNEMRNSFFEFLGFDNKGRPINSVEGKRRGIELVEEPAFDFVKKYAKLD